MIYKTKVMTRNFFLDFVARIQNLFGMDLASYEDMINNGIESIKQELEDEGVKLKWFRIETTQLTNGAIVILLYGE